MRTAFSTNLIILQGNVTRDPEMKVTQSGAAIMRIGLATNYSKKVGDDYEDVTTYHNIVCFGKSAEWLQDRIKKGHKIMVTGRQENRTFDKDDGTKGYVSEVIAETVTPFLQTNGSSKKGDLTDQEYDSEKIASEIPF